MNGRLIAGRYELTGPLGRGAMGQVWEARDHGLGGRRIAVKLMHSGQVASLAGGTDPEELRGRFERECRVTAQLDHPGLVAVHDAGRDGDDLYLVMQLLEGSDLRDHLAEREPYPWRWAVAVAAQLCSALVAVHGVGIVHRDLKPGNVIVREDGRVVILDLGIASVRTGGETARLTRTGALVGTPAYMAPEQAVGGSPVGPRADLYALGTLLYELLTGRIPFQAPEPHGLLYKKLHHTPHSVRELRPEVPAELADLVRRLLDRGPEGRPADAREVYVALAPLLPRPGAAGPVLPLDPTRPFREPMAPWPPHGPAAAVPPPPPQAGPPPQSPPAGPGTSAPGFGPPPPWPPAPAAGLGATLEEARALLTAGHYTRVAELLGGALPAAVAEHGPQSPVVRTLRKQYAAVLLDTGQYARALPELTRLAQEYTAERGPYDPVVAQLRRDESLCRERLGR
ncbi:serine/threonine protein kinase [Streptomyces carminius]|uniref:non-specific serine/threonine protein kinase n=1 Tax=Streptomyces carminius TaxID=2665496 RepID=A0A2M8LUU1_9ACTN|nr:serine/threonine-protein kinase [Streptomyces carminius]PJE95689.1 serine/threonine protein kinase [Streptomyces carminius]